MNVKDKMQLLNNAIQQLMELYQILDSEFPHIVPAHNNSELKKITQTL